MSVMSEEDKRPSLMAAQAVVASVGPARRAVRQLWTAPSVLPVAVDEITRLGTEVVVDGAVVQS
ncbi:hypothetical protein [Ancylobacter sp. IITR112]|uniref:hypothetical protein n=1 Tax=Ancylobacter sp. IITR112 TaxID=3138073 RepID=UPI00352AB6F0